MLKNLLYLTGFSTFVVIVIIALDVYHNYELSQLPPITQKNIIPISKNFDTKTLDELKKREAITVNLQNKSTVVSEDSKDTTSSVTPSPNIPSSQNISSGSGSQTAPSALQP